MQTWAQDIKYAMRTIVRRPGFTVVVVGTLALGLGANTAVFSVIDKVLLSPLPYGEPQRLVRLYQVFRDTPGDLNYLTLPALVSFRDGSRTLELGAVYTYSPSGVDLMNGDRPERVRVLPVGSDYFRVLRAEPMLGRRFRRDEERSDARVAVVSASLWRRVLHEDAGALGRTLTLDGIPHTVIGVMPDRFEDPLEGAIDIWLPLDLPTGGWASWQWDNHYLSAIARLRPGVTLTQAQREIDDLSRRQAEVGVDVDDQFGRLVPLKEDIVGTADTMLYILMGAVALLLLLACVNVASLFLARGAAREQELAIRSALGSSRPRLAGQLFAESGILALAGGVVGLALGLGLSRVLTVAAPFDLLGGEAPPFNTSVFAFALGVALVAGVAFGMVPAWRFSRPRLREILSESSRGSVGRRTIRARNALVVTETSLALVLLIGAGVLIRSFQKLQRVNLHLAPTNVVTFSVHLPGSRYAEAEARVRFHRELERRLASLAGVRAVGAVSRLPVTGRFHTWGVSRAIAEGVPTDEVNVPSDQRVVEGDYFRALGIPVLRGRVFGPQDRVDAPLRVVVNQALARALYGDEDPVGHLLRIGGYYDRTIIGVVADVPVTARGEVVPKVYHAHAQFANSRNWALTQVVALDGPRPDILDAARRELAAIDPALVLDQPRPLVDVIGRGRARERFAMHLIAALAGLAVLLAAIGIYSVLAYSVSGRRREIGIRMALGARARTVHRMVVGQGMLLAVLGIVLGLITALVATRWLSTLVFEVSVRDPFVFGSGAGVLAGVALLACYLPARRATRVDPVETFRQQ